MFVLFHVLAISIHALREEGDLELSNDRATQEISIHALREEGDCAPPRRGAGSWNFYPRPPRGGRPSFALIGSSPPVDFYPRPPRGGRPPCAQSSSASRQFLSTPSARRATLEALRAHLDVAISIHALREEGDLGILLRVPLRIDFYPRPPRGGRPRYYLAGSVSIAISIHALREEGDPSTSNSRPRTYTFLSTPSARRATSIPGLVDHH